MARILEEYNNGPAANISRSLTRCMALEIPEPGCRPTWLRPKRGKIEGYIYILT